MQTNSEQHDSYCRGRGPIQIWTSHMQSTAACCYMQAGSAEDHYQTLMPVINCHSLQNLDVHLMHYTFITGISKDLRPE